MTVLTVGFCSGQPATAVARHVQKFEREPEDQTAVVGETVVMACRVINKSGVLQWTKDDFGLGSDRNLSGFERYSMIGTEDEGTCPFLIKNLLPTARERKNTRKKGVLYSNLNNIKESKNLVDDQDQVSVLNSVRKCLACTSSSSSSSYLGLIGCFIKTKTGRRGKSISESLT